MEPEEIQIQPIIHLDIQPVITYQIQPVIAQKIQPVVHKEIQPIIHEVIQPVITKEIQPIIKKKIQPVIFMENQTNIEEKITQLEQSQKQKDSKIIEKHLNQIEINPLTAKKVVCSEKVMVRPYIMRVEQHSSKVEEKTETIKEITEIEIVEYVPYIQYKNGKILPYKKKETKEKKEKKEQNSIKTSYQTMETIIAVNFISLNYNINYPMAFKKTDIFSKIEKKLYHEFPILKSKQIFFVANGKTIDRSLTFEQNKIKSGNTILINEIEK